MKLKTARKYYDAGQLLYYTNAGLTIQMADNKKVCFQNVCSYKPGTKRYNLFRRGYNDNCKHDGHRITT